MVPLLSLRKITTTTLPVCSLKKTYSHNINLLLISFDLSWLLVDGFVNFLLPVSSPFLWSLVTFYVFIEIYLNQLNKLKLIAFYVFWYNLIQLFAFYLFEMMLKCKNKVFTSVFQFTRVKSISFALILYPVFYT